MIEFIITWRQPDGMLHYCRIRLTDWLLDSTPERIALALEQEVKYLKAELRKEFPGTVLVNPHVTTRTLDADLEIEVRPLTRGELVTETYLRWLLGEFGSAAVPPETPQEMP